MRTIALSNYGVVYSLNCSNDVGPLWIHVCKRLAGQKKTSPVAKNEFWFSIETKISSAIIFSFNTQFKKKSFVLYIDKCKKYNYNLILHTVQCTNANNQLIL